MGRLWCLTSNCIRRRNQTRESDVEPMNDSTSTVTFSSIMSPKTSAMDIYCKEGTLLTPPNAPLSQLEARREVSRLIAIAFSGDGSGSPLDELSDSRTYWTSGVSRTQVPEMTRSMMMSPHLRQGQGLNWKGIGKAKRLFQRGRRS